MSDHSTSATSARLEGQVAVVTGAGSGIGRAIAQSIAAEGARLYLLGRTREKLEETLQSFGPAALPADLWPIDLARDEEIDQLERHLEASGVDVLVMSAGEYLRGAVEETPVESFDRLYEVNVRANYRLMRALLPMLKRRPGQIVFINSSCGLAARPEVSQFSATNHALRALADALRGEIAPFGVRVLSVFPGMTNTPRLELIRPSSEQQFQPELLLQPEDVASVVLNALTLPRTAEVTDISIRPQVKSY
jgi:NADP-dependent 3-hydroxy acid dehydrogenase YdfG